MGCWLLEVVCVATAFISRVTPAPRWESISRAGVGFGKSHTPTEHGMAGPGGRLTARCPHSAHQIPRAEIRCWGLAGAGGPAAQRALTPNRAGCGTSRGAGSRGGGAILNRQRTGIATKPPPIGPEAMRFIRDRQHTVGETASNTAPGPTANAVSEAAASRD
jgi:hypothetical protein